MIAGIVGSEAAKFTPETRQKARCVIADILLPDEVTGMSSGGCHLGGIDEWAEEIARDMHIPCFIFRPKVLNWSNGFKPRNIQIANISDIVHVITVRTLPPDYKGMRFDLCYHCMTADHVKSGGCWTAHYALQHGKQAVWHII